LMFLLLFEKKIIQLKNQDQKSCYSKGSAG